MTQGVAVETSQYHDFQHIQIMPDGHLCRNIGTWAPVICNTEAEKFYIETVCLLIGKDCTDMVYVRGDESGIGQKYSQGIPPTYLRIPHL